MDGSAAPFVLLIQQSGIEEQGAPKRFLRVKKRIEAKDGDKWAALEPYEGFRLSFSIVYDHPVIEKSNTSLTVDFASTSYLKEGAPAPTASCRTSRTCATSASPWAAAWRTPWCSTSTAC
jgi:UDP-3-O-[3-hydroxymyristoyl] N-acetylglucosamine deacetylase